MISISHVLSLGVLATVALAAPLRVRDTTANCTSLGKGPLGFNASAIGTYNYYQPGYHLTFDNTQLNRYGDDYLLANPAHAYDNPEFFELFSCLYSPPEFEGKGSIAVYQGYIQTSDGNCIQRTEIDSTAGQFSKKPCAFDLDNLSGDSAAQHFQFSIDTFYSYYTIVPLGSEQGPSNNANGTLGSGGNYKLSLLDLPNLPKQNFVEVDYVSGAEQAGGDANDFMIAQVGNQYQPDKTSFPTCTLVKNGTLSFTDDSGDHPVSVSSVTYSEYNTGLGLFTNGSQSSQGFEFYQCDSYYMNYTNSGSQHYGHFLTSQDTRYNACFSRDTGNDAGSNPNAIYTQTVCSTSDNSQQLSQFFSYNDVTGEVHFLGATSSNSSTTVNYWTLQGDQIVLTSTPNANNLHYV